MRRNLAATLALILALSLRAPAGAQSFSSGSTGADGALAPTASVTLDLPADGVFHFTTITIPAGVTLRFARNAANSPVTLLATGNVVIAGTIDVSGAPGGGGSASTQLGPNHGAGGPGGFDGGSGANGILGLQGGAGRGPGAGAAGTGHNVWGGGAGFVVPGTAGGSHGGPTGGAPGGAAYGAPPLLPLVGGSGGGGGGTSALGATGGGGGGGGGALLVACSGTITLTGTIRARGGNGGGVASAAVGAGGAGSGGAVRLVAASITGSGGTIDVAGGTAQNGGGLGSSGRLRVEALASSASLSLGAAPQAAVSTATPGPVRLAEEPTLRITSVGGTAAPLAPTGSFAVPDVVLPAGTGGPLSLTLAARHIPPGTVVTVVVQGQTGGATSTTTSLAGTLAASTASTSVTLPSDQPALVSASASFVLADAGGAPLPAP